MKKYVFILGLFLITTGCATQTEADPQGVILDAGDFTILAPSDWAFIPKMGIDSTVGQFSDGEMTLIFDYGVNAGVYSNNSVYFEDPSAYTVTQEIIDGFEAKIYVPNEANAEKPTVLSIENINDVKPCTEEVCVLNQEDFQMLGDGLNEEQMALALQIFRSVDFK
ncbi:MAG: hypothetical protein WC777_06295 [Candidatus Gracilibacteria bacterium]|jgi:hypothetical protein